MAAKPKTYFIDSSSCLHDRAIATLEGDLMTRLAAEGARLVVARKVEEELLKHVRSDEATLRVAARDALRFIKAGASTGALLRVGEERDQFPDALFQTIFARYRTEFPCVLITQDVSLMADILKQAGSLSVTRNVHQAQVWTIDENTGVLRPVELMEVERRLAGQSRRALAKAAVAANDFEPYAITGGVTTTSTPIRASGPEPVENAVLISDSGTRVTLVQRLGRGGEGTVYSTSQQGQVAKVYSAHCLTRERHDKLRRMVEHGLDWADPRSAGICWPTSLLSDNGGSFRGYLMPEAKGEPLANGVFIGTNLRRKYPDWDRINLVNLCLAITKKIQFLHNANVLVGDINQNNIFVSSDEEVYFLDADSYQVEMWPCPVGTIHFTPPELQGRRFNDLLRTKEHERFAVATLLFMILHAGKPPYAQTHGEDPAQNIRNRRFPYPLRDRHAQNAPEGPWRFIWSNLSLRTKEAFFRSFDATHAHEPRIALEEWISVLNMYKYHLENHDIAPGHVERQLFPTEYKRLSAHAIQMYGQISQPRVRVAASGSRRGH